MPLLGCDGPRAGGAREGTDGSPPVYRSFGGRRGGYRADAGELRNVNRTHSPPTDPDSLTTVVTSPAVVMVPTHGNGKMKRDRVAR